MYHFVSVLSCSYSIWLFWWSDKPVNCTEYISEVGDFWCVVIGPLITYCIWLAGVTLWKRFNVQMLYALCVIPVCLWLFSVLIKVKSIESVRPFFSISICFLIIYVCMCSIAAINLVLLELILDPVAVMCVSYSVDSVTASVCSSSAHWYDDWSGPCIKYCRVSHVLLYLVLLSVLCFNIPQ